MPEKEVVPPPKSVDELKGFARIKNQRIGHILIAPTFLCALIFYGIVSGILMIFAIAWLASAGGNKDFTFRYDNIWQSKVDLGNDWTFNFTFVP